jgi:hypothetical protein
MPHDLLINESGLQICFPFRRKFLSFSENQSEHDPIDSLIHRRVKGN